MPLDESNFQAVYGAWASRDETDAAALLTGYPCEWWVVGGRAIEAFTRHGRPHEDIDIATHRSDLQTFRRHTADRFHLWLNQGGSLTPIFPEDDDSWPTDFLQLWLRRDAAQPWEFDVLFEPGERGVWVNRRWPSMVLPLDEVTWTGSNGVRYQNPEIVLLFKARRHRRKDDIDFQATAPLLNQRQRRWLSKMLALIHPGHPWIIELDI